MRLEELVPLMRSLGARRVVLSPRGEVVEAELFPTTPDVVPLPPLDPPLAPIEVGETAAPAEPEDEPPPGAPAPRQTDPGEQAAMTRLAQQRQREKAAARARAYEDSILFAAAGYCPPNLLLSENDEDDL